MNNFVNNIVKNTYFWVIFVAVTIVFCLFSVNKFSSYSSKINVLLLPKNEKIATNIVLIKNNIEFLFENEKKVINGGEVNISSDPNNTIISFETFSNSRQSLQDYNQSVIKQMLEVASKHYDVKRDLEMRLVGNVETGSQPASLFLIVVISLTGGFFSSLVLFAILNALFNAFSKSRDIVLTSKERIAKVEIGKAEEDNDINDKKEKAEKPTTRDEVAKTLVNSRINGEAIANPVEEMYKKNEKLVEKSLSNKSEVEKSAVPSNLPIEKEEEKKEIKSYVEINKGVFLKGQQEAGSVVNEERIQAAIEKIKQSKDFQDKFLKYFGEKKVEAKNDAESLIEKNIQQIAKESTKKEETKRESAREIKEEEKKEEKKGETENEKAKESGVMGRGVVPSNLPFEIIEETAKKIIEEKEVEQIVEEKTVEPTKEEYKRRLNQLLRGEI